MYKTTAARLGEDGENIYDTTTYRVYNLPITKRRDPGERLQKKRTRQTRCMQMISSSLEHDRCVKHDTLAYVWNTYSLKSRHCAY